MFLMAPVPGRSEAPPGLEAYFLDFFDFLAFFAFFAFFAFLAIVSSQGLMDGNATRGMLGGGPTSQHPRMQSQQIRGVLPRTVTSVSARYPQLLCVLARFHAGGGGLRRKNLRAMNDHAARRLGRVNDPPTCRRILHRSGTGRAASLLSSSFQNHGANCSAAGESPLSGLAASYP